MAGKKNKKLFFKKGVVMKSPSFVHFKNDEIRHASNDGMEILGHFLRSQVRAQADYFLELVKNPGDIDVASGPYFIETQGDSVSLIHLENEWLFPFETTRKNFEMILKKWEGFCKDASSSACNIKGSDLFLIRSIDGDSFTFETEWARS